jgi:hypothetical protein
MRLGLKQTHTPINSGLSGTAGRLNDESYTRKDDSMNLETDVTVKEILEQTGFDLIFRQ